MKLDLYKIYTKTKSPEIVVNYLQQVSFPLYLFPICSDAILDPTTTPITCQSSLIEESLELPLQITAGSSRSSGTQQNQQQQQQSQQEAPVPLVRPITIPLTGRFGLGGGKPSAAALRRGPGRPKRDFLPLLKMSTNPSGSGNGTGGSPVSSGPTLKFSGGVLTGTSLETKLIKR